MKLLLGQYLYNIVQKALYYIESHHKPATNPEQKGSDDPKTEDSSFPHFLKLFFALLRFLLHVKNPQILQTNNCLL